MLQVADAARRAGCKDVARRLYDRVLQIYVGFVFSSLRERAAVNVEQLDAIGKSIARFCFVPAGHLPVGDTVLAQKLALELFETEALQIAARSPPCQGLYLPYEFRY